MCTCISVSDASNYSSVFINDSHRSIIQHRIRKTNYFNDLYRCSPTHHSLLLPKQFQTRRPNNVVSLITHRLRKSTSINISTYCFSTSLSPKQMTLAYWNRLASDESKQLRSNITKWTSTILFLTPNRYLTV